MLGIRRGPADLGHPDHLRHDARGRLELLWRRLEHDAEPGSPGRRGGALRRRVHRGSADPSGARVDADRALSGAAHRAQQRQPLHSPARRETLAEARQRRRACRPAAIVSARPCSTQSFGLNAGVRSRTTVPMRSREHSVDLALHADRFRAKRRHRPDAIAWLKGRDRDRRFFLWIALCSTRTGPGILPRSCSRPGAVAPTNDLYLGDVAAGGPRVRPTSSTPCAPTARSTTTVVLVVADHGGGLRRARRVQPRRLLLRANRAAGADDHPASPRRPADARTSATTSGRQRRRRPCRP